MFSGLISALLLCIIVWGFWKLFRMFILISPLDNIPDAPMPSKSHNDLPEQHGGVAKIRAFMGNKALLVSDPKALHHVIVKDQHIYEEVPIFIEGNRCAFGPGLLSSLGDEHRKQRKMLNPVFSIAYMREMVPIFNVVVQKLRDAFACKTKDGPREIEVLSWLSRTALELIGQSGFGYSFDPLTEDAAPHPYAVSLKSFTLLPLKSVVVRQFVLPALSMIGSRRFKRFVVDHILWKSLRDFVKNVEIMRETSVEVIKTKKMALAEGDETTARGKDIMSILLRANIQADEEDKLSEEELIAQISTLTFTAMDTTSSALARIFWVLVRHQDVQDKLRLEIRNARKKHGGDLTYDELVNLPYLDAVCKETLRLYPPLKMLLRITRQDIVLPIGTPIDGLNGKKISEILIPNGTLVLIDIHASNTNPEIWGPDSYEWKPERWLKPLPESVTAARIPGIYSNLMTFLGGGRACIGFKFSQLEMKVVLLLLLESFKFSLSDKEIIWVSSGIAAPSTVNDPSRLQLPLVVERVS